MSARALTRLLALLGVIAAMALVACGGDDGDGGGDSGDGAQEQSGGGNVTEQLFAGTARDNRQTPDQGKKGGKLTVLSGGDVDYMDPGKTYYLYAIAVMSATHRGLYAYLPGKPEPVPDLAEADPEISEDGKTVTVKIRKGVMFSEPVKREVTSKDVKYALERAFTSNVANGYARAYLRDIEGVPEEPGPYKEIPGIQTPDDQTLVLKLTEGTGAAAAGALSMPISVPVPKEFAQRYDRKNPSTYGEEYAVFTGPYKVESDAQGKQTGYVAGRSIKLVRNPDYRNVGDFRPAFVDEIEYLAGNEDSSVTARRVLSGQNLATGDGGPPASRLKRLLQSNKAELSAVSGGGWRDISMDTSRPPFDDINVRKAVIAGFNRTAARQQRGGEALGPMAQHFIPPNFPGFEESGGENGWVDEMDWMAKPEGDRALSAEYFKKAGMASGRYEGSEKLLMVADNAEPDKSIAQITEQQLTEMGFDVTLRLVTRDTMLTRFCSVPKSEVNVCPSFGWSKDFNDPQTLLDPTFNGANIVPTQNTNWPELDVPEVNAAIEKAKLETNPETRNQAWADANKAITAQASVIPYMWDYLTVAASPNVRLVQNDYSAVVDPNFTSIR